MMTGKLVALILFVTAWGLSCAVDVFAAPPDGLDETLTLEFSDGPQAGQHEVYWYETHARWARTESEALTPYGGDFLAVYQIAPEPGAPYIVHGGYGELGSWSWQLSYDGSGGWLDTGGGGGDYQWDGGSAATLDITAGAIPEPGGLLASFTVASLLLCSRRRRCMSGPSSAVVS